MRRATWLSVCLLPGLVALGRPQAPADKPAPAPAEKVPAAPSVEQLIEQLGAADYRQRDAAGQALQALGAKALPALQKAREHPDPEVRRRLAALIPQVENAAVLQPKRLTLTVTKKPLSKIFEEITKQTGYKVEMWGGNDQQLYDFKCDNLTFWEAFDRLSQTCGLHLQFGYGDDRLRVMHQDGFAPYVCYDGAFRIAANNFHDSRSIDFSFFQKNTAVARRSQNLSFSFTVCSEPRLPLMGVGEVRVLEAVDSEGRSMVPGAGGNGGAFGGPMMIGRFGYGYRSCVMQAQAALHRPSEEARSLKRMRASVGLTLLVEQKPMVVAEEILKAKGKKTVCGQTTFQIEDVTVTPAKQYQIKMVLTHEDKENPNDYTWLNSLHQRLELQDAKGNKFQVYGQQWQNTSPTQATMTWTYGHPNGAGDPPTKFIYYVWNTMQHQVSFEFKDLPLP